MKISRVKLEKFRRFLDLEICNLPDSARLVILAGPNGNGKSSLFDAFLIASAGYTSASYSWDKDYHTRVGIDLNENKTENKPTIEFHLKTTDERTKNLFHFRSAFRNDPAIKGSMSWFSSINDEDRARIKKFTENDAAVGENYKRLIGFVLQELFDTKSSSMGVREFRDQAIGELGNALKKIFPDLHLNTLGNPATDQSFRFDKGTVQGYKYETLSGGEKAAFDLILDLFVSSRTKAGAIICIDEPEAHLNPKVHAKVLETMLELTVQAGQLWIATHSIGMLRKAMEIEKENPGTVVFLDFGCDFDKPQVLEPIVPSRNFWLDTLDVALADLAKLVAPTEIVICEGGESQEIGDEISDAAIYNLIFSETHPKTRFISVGNSLDVESARFLTIQAMSRLFSGCTVLRLIDRDEMTDAERNRKLDDGIRVLRFRHLETYLFSDELMSKLAVKYGKNSDKKRLLQVRSDALKNAEQRGNGPDNMKKAAGEIREKCRRILNLENSGKTTQAFMRDVMAPLLTPDTETFKTLENDIFRNTKSV